MVRGVGPAATCLLAAAALTGVARAKDRPAGAFSGVVAMTLEDAVPFECRDEPLHLGPHSWVTAEPIPGTGVHNPYRDLHVELICRDGRWDPRPWAYAVCMPGVEHAGKVLEAEITATRARVVVEFHLQPRRAEHYGGRARYTLLLTRRGSSLRGGYRGETRSDLPRTTRRLWSHRTMARKVPWVGRVKAAEVVGRSFGRIRPLPRPIGRFVPPAADEHPRLLLRPGDLADLRARAETPAGKAIVAALRKRLEGRPAEPAKADLAGYRAAGWGLLWLLDGEAARAARAASEARRALPDPAAGETLAAMRDLAGLALAYDLCGSAWDEALRREVAAHLRRRAEQLVSPAADPSDPAAPSAPVEGPHDYRLATRRAAAGLAALAVRGDFAGDSAATEGLERTIAAVDRWARRFLAAGLGDRGCGTGSAGLREMGEIVFPFLQAYRTSAGVDLAAGTGAEWAAVWHLATRGMALGPVGGPSKGPAGPLGGWLATGLGVMAPRFRPAARWLIDRRGLDVDTPLAGVLGLVNYPHRVEPAPPGRVLPTTLLDGTLGGYVFRSGWDLARDFVTLVELAGGPSQAAAGAGNVRLFGLGREWITVPAATGGPFAWPLRRERNVIQIGRAPLTSQKPLYPVAGAALAQVRAHRPNLGCISLQHQHFSERPPAEGPLGRSDRSRVELLLARRVIGVDYSGVSGAEAVLVFVDGVYGAGPRTRWWQIHLGEVSPEEVTIRFNTFEVRPAGAGATLKGTVVYPDTAHLAYRPPEKGRPGLLLAWPTKPKLTNEEMFRESFEAARRLGGPRTRRADDGGLREKAVESAQARQRRRADAEVAYGKLLEATSSIQQGAGDRRGRVRDSFIVVLTVQTARPPAVHAAPAGDETLLLIGKQKVTYRENYFLFDRSK